MSVIMTLWGRGDPAKIEEFAAGHQDLMQSVLERAKENGLIAHRFYGSDGQIMVIDEWPDAESFQRFFSSVEADVAPIFAAAGITDEPSVSFWRKLETHDEYGWD